MQTAKDVLELLDGAYSELSETEQEKLWSVLTALRGPDSGSSAVKLATTAVIRDSVFRKSYLHVAIKNSDRVSYATFRNETVPPNQSSPDHFWEHAKMAFEALDLKWAESNDDIGYLYDLR